MKKIIALSICTILGTLAGYFAAPILSMAAAQSSDPDIFAVAMLANYKNSVVCDCLGQPVKESAKGLSEYLSILQKFREKNQKSAVPAQELGLTYVRLSLVERRLDEQSHADEDMKHGQAELATIGWKDTSSTHLTFLVTQLNSEYKPADGNKKTVAAAATTPR